MKLNLLTFLVGGIVGQIIMTQMSALFAWSSSTTSILILSGYVVWYLILLLTSWKKIELIRGNQILKDYSVLNLLALVFNFYNLFSIVLPGFESFGQKLVYGTIYLLMLLLIVIFKNKADPSKIKASDDKAVD